LCVRPEEMRLVHITADPARGRGGEPCVGFRGRVAGISARGPLVRIEVQADPQRWVSLMTAGEFRAVCLAVGDPVRIELPREAIHLLALS